jgi:hypothetical protein
MHTHHVVYACNAMLSRRSALWQLKSFRQEKWRCGRSGYLASQVIRMCDGLQTRPHKHLKAQTERPCVCANLSEAYQHLSEAYRQLQIQYLSRQHNHPRGLWIDSCVCALCKEELVAASDVCVCVPCGHVGGHYSCAISGSAADTIQCAVCYERSRFVKLQTPPSA